MMHRRNPHLALATSAVLTAWAVSSSSGGGGDEPRKVGPPPAAAKPASGAKAEDCCLCEGSRGGGTAARGRFSRSTATYKLPDVSLVEMNGEAVSLASALDHDGPVLLQFAFTTCPTICPVLSGTLSAAQGKLGEDRERTRMVTISIDPEHDTPARLRAYARSMRAGPQWRFFTGKAEDVEDVLKAFDAYRGNKMRHEPLTFLRPSRNADWIRLVGLMGAEELVSEYRRAVKK